VDLGIQSLSLFSTGKSEQKDLSILILLLCPVDCRCGHAIDEAHEDVRPSEKSTAASEKMRKRRLGMITLCHAQSVKRIANKQPGKFERPISQIHNITMQSKAISNKKQK
jgi:hypothetical protein